MAYTIIDNSTTLSQWNKFQEYSTADVNYEFYEPKPDAGITMNTGKDEMLRVTPDGFYVRGVRVEQDDKEAEIVYNAFKQWLAWANLQRK